MWRSIPVILFSFLWQPYLNITLATNVKLFSLWWHLYLNIILARNLINYLILFSLLWQLYLNIILAWNFIIYLILFSVLWQLYLSIILARNLRMYSLEKLFSPHCGCMQWLHTVHVNCCWKSWLMWGVVILFPASLSPWQIAWCVWSSPCPFLYSFTPFTLHWYSTHFSSLRHSILCDTHFQTLDWPEMWKSIHYLFSSSWEPQLNVILYWIQI